MKTQLYADVSGLSERPESIFSDLNTPNLLSNMELMMDKFEDGSDHELSDHDINFVAPPRAAPGVVLSNKRSSPVPRLQQTTRSSSGAVVAPPISGGVVAPPSSHKGGGPAAAAFESRSPVVRSGPANGPAALPGVPASGRLVLGQIAGRAGKLESSDDSSNSEDSSGGSSSEDDEDEPRGENSSSKSSSYSGSSSSDDEDSSKAKRRRTGDDLVSDHRQRSAPQPDGWVGSAPGLPAGNPGGSAVLSSGGGGTTPALLVSAGGPALTGATAGSSSAVVATGPISKAGLTLAQRVKEARAKADRAAAEARENHAKESLQSAAAQEQMQNEGEVREPDEPPAKRARRETENSSSSSSSSDEDEEDHSPMSNKRPSSPKGTSSSVREEPPVVRSLPLLPSPSSPPNSPKESPESPDVVESPMEVESPVVESPANDEEEENLPGGPIPMDVEERPSAAENPQDKIAEADGASNVLLNGNGAAAIGTSTGNHDAQAPPNLAGVLNPVYSPEDSEAAGAPLDSPADSDNIIGVSLDSPADSDNIIGVSLDSPADADNIIGVSLDSPADAPDSPGDLDEPESPADSDRGDQEDPSSPLIPTNIAQLPQGSPRTPLLDVAASSESSRKDKKERNPFELDAKLMKVLEREERRRRGRGALGPSSSDAVVLRGGLTTTAPASTAAPGEKPPTILSGGTGGGTGGGASGSTQGQAAGTTSWSQKSLRILEFSRLESVGRVEEATALLAVDRDLEKLIRKNAQPHEFFLILGVGKVGTYNKLVQTKAKRKADTAHLHQKLDMVRERAKVGGVFGKKILIRLCVSPRSYPNERVLSSVRSLCSTTPIEHKFSSENIMVKVQRTY